MNEFCTDSPKQFVLFGNVYCKDYLFLKIYLFRKGRVTERRKGREIVHLLVHCQKWLPWPALDQAEVKSRNLHPGLPHRWQGQSIWAIVCCSLWHINRELVWKCCFRTWASTQVDRWGCTQQLIPLHRSAGPKWLPFVRDFSVALRIWLLIKPNIANKALLL